jgi:hypothetical protein
VQRRGIEVATMAKAHAAILRGAQSQPEPLPAAMPAER